MPTKTVLFLSTAVRLGWNPWLHAFVVPTPFQGPEDDPRLVVLTGNINDRTVDLGPLEHPLRAQMIEGMHA